jgi:DNA-binding transcriptional MocR family regulator
VTSTTNSPSVHKAASPVRPINQGAPIEATRQTDPTLPPGSLNLSGNLPPVVAEVFEPQFRAAISSVLASGNLADTIGAHRFMGTARDRSAGAQFLAQRLSEPPEPGRVVVTNGTQSALDRLFNGLVGSGGILAVEELTYPAIKHIAQRLGIRLRAVRMDEMGAVPADFAALCSKDRPSAYYTLPTIHNPTTRTTPLERRMELIAIARKHGVVFIEDDIYSLLPSDLPPPLAALAPDISWYVLGTAKSVAPGIKIAYVVAPNAKEVDRVFWPGVVSTYWMPAPLNAEIATVLIESGGAEEIISAVRTEVSHRHEMAHRQFDGIPFITSPGALNLWLPLPSSDMKSRLVAEARRENVIIGTSNAFVVGDTQPPDAVRVGIGTVLTRDQLERGLSVLRNAYRRLQS